MPLQPAYTYRATVTNVVDGDTVDVSIDCGLYISTARRVRILGINAPEVHGQSKEAGLRAAAYTRAQLLGKDVMLATQKPDDFGRVLATVEVDGENYGDRMIAAGMAVPFMVPKAG